MNVHLERRPSPSTAPHDLYQSTHNTFIQYGTAVTLLLVVNLLAPEFGIQILAHPLCKMRIIQERKKLAL
jgi:hypothetical protein